MKLIVGLGNPGPQYAGTRHNIGFDAVDVLAARCGARLSGERFHGWFEQAELHGSRVGLLKPTTFMNRSGRAVLAAGRFYKIELADLLVITDDFALPLGTLRMRAKGSSGGHNGLQDIVDMLGTDEWCRLRIGVGPAIGDPAAFVLNRFGRDEDPVARAAAERAAEAAACWVANGPERTMTKYNGPLPGLDKDKDTEP